MLVLLVANTRSRAVTEETARNWNIPKRAERIITDRVIADGGYLLEHIAHQKQHALPLLEEIMNILMIVSLATSTYFYRVEHKMNNIHVNTNSTISIAMCTDSKMLIEQHC